MVSLVQASIFLLFLFVRDNGYFPDGVACPPTYTRYGADRCLLYRDSKKTKSTAQNSCPNGGLLAKVDSAEMSTFIKNMADGTSSEEDTIWFGLNDEMFEGFFLQSNNEVPSWTNWKKESAEPRGHRLFNCVVMDLSHEHLGWEVRSCLQRHAFVCEYGIHNPTTEEERNGCLNYTSNEPAYKTNWPICIVRAPNALPWGQARAYCKDSDSELASITPQIAATFTPEIISTTYWIGLRGSLDGDAQGVYRWADSTCQKYYKEEPERNKFGNWPTIADYNESGGECVIADGTNDHDWRTLPCTSTQRFFCGHKRCDECVIGDLTSVKFSSFTVKNSTDHRLYAVYTCNYGYMFPDGSHNYTRWCSACGRWEPAPSDCITDPDPPATSQVAYQTTEPLSTENSQQTSKPSTDALVTLKIVETTFDMVMSTSLEKTATTKARVSPVAPTLEDSNSNSEATGHLVTTVSTEGAPPTTTAIIPVANGAPIEDLKTTDSATKQQVTSSDLSEEFTPESMDVKLSSMHETESLSLLSTPKMLSTAESESIPTLARHYSTMLISESTTSTNAGTNVLDETTPSDSTSQSLEEMCEEFCRNSSFVDEASSSLVRQKGHCEYIHQWNGYNLSTAETVVGTVVTYSCPQGFVFLDGRSHKMTKCTHEKEWRPTLENCIVGRGDIDTPTEAPGSAGIGAAALIVLLSELIFTLILDISTIILHIRMLCNTLKSKFKQTSCESHHNEDLALADSCG